MKTVFFRSLAASVTLGGLLVSGCSHSSDSGPSSSSTSTGSGSASTNSGSLLNVSYDPTRELYQEYNKAFATYYKAKSGQDVTVSQSHGGSGKQARAVIDGEEADVVTLALPIDIDAIAGKGLLDKDWSSKFPDNSSPYTSVIVFVVRQGNPKHIQDWDDLVKPGVQVITANPKTGGGARLNYLSAWGYALHHNGGSEAKARDFVAALYRNVPVLDSGARGSTTTFTQRGIGDVLIAWENEALLASRKLGAGQFEIVTPSESILAEPPVAVVDAYAKKHGTVQLAHDYLEYLYSSEGQEIAAKNYYRPRDPAVAAKYAAQFQPIKTWTLESLLGSWPAVQKKHFADGGVFDSIYQPHG